MKQTIVTLDLEGVLVPEIWIAVAEKTGIEALKRTTRDEPDYDVLMRGRLALLKEHGLKLSDIQAVIDAEQKAKPLSDQTLAESLQQSGIQVARRTVAKYREAMHIPSSSDRLRKA